MRKVEHQLNYKIDVDELARRLSKVEGRELGVVSRPPTDDEPGVVIFEDYYTGVRLELDPADVVFHINEILEEEKQAKLRAEISLKHAKPDVPPEPPKVTPHAQDRLKRFKEAWSDEERWSIFEEILTAIAQEERAYIDHVEETWRKTHKM